MTATVEPRMNGHRPNVTVGDDVRVCGCAPENPAEAADRPDSAQGSAFTPVHTRAIPQEPDIRPAKQPSKIGNFASTHLGDAKAAANASWFGRERPTALFDAAAQVFPAKSEAGNWVAWVAMSFAGVLRLAALSLIYLAAFCFDGRIRAAVSTTLLCAAVCAHHLTT